MKIVFAVCTCRKRKEQGVDGKNIIDQIPGCFEVYDHEMLGSWWGHTYALQKTMDEGADWGVVLEDDAVLCAGFYEKAIEAIENLDPSGVPLGKFFIMDKDDKQYKYYGRWRVEPVAKWSCDQANFFRRDIGLAYCAWANEFRPQYMEMIKYRNVIKKNGETLHRDSITVEYDGEARNIAADQVFRRWAKVHLKGLMFAIHNPHLVDHCLDYPSVVGTSVTQWGYTRDSKRFIDAD